MTFEQIRRRVDQIETGDAAYIAKALDVVARAKGMAQISELHV